MRLWRIGTLSWRAGQIYLALVVVAAVAAAAWTTRYWTRGRSYFGESLPRVSRALPAVARERVEKSPVEGSAETAALALWVFGPLALPAVGVVAGLLLVGVRRRRRAALVVALLIAAAALPVAYGGGRA